MLDSEIKKEKWRCSKREWTRKNRGHIKYQIEFHPVEQDHWHNEPKAPRQSSVLMLIAEKATGLFFGTTSKSLF